MQATRATAVSRLRLLRATAESQHWNATTAAAVVHVSRFILENSHRIFGRSIEENPLPCLLPLCRAPGVCTALPASRRPRAGRGPASPMDRHPAHYTTSVSRKHGHDLQHYSISATVHAYLICSLTLNILEKNTKFSRLATHPEVGSLNLLKNLRLRECIASSLMFRDGFTHRMVAVNMLLACCP